MNAPRATSSASAAGIAGASEHWNDSGGSRGVWITGGGGFGEAAQAIKSNTQARRIDAGSSNLCTLYLFYDCLHAAGSLGAQGCGLLHSSDNALGFLPLGVDR